VDKEKLKEEYLKLLEEFNSIKREYEEVINRILELETYASFLKEISKKDEWEGFTNLGGMILLKSKIFNTKKVLVNVGANVFVEKDIEEVIDILEEQAKQYNNLKQELEKTLEEYSKKLMELREEITES